MVAEGITIGDPLMLEFAKSAFGYARFSSGVLCVGVHASSGSRWRVVRPAALLLSRWYS
jgi:hypothetical protein